MATLFEHAQAVEEEEDLEDEAESPGAHPRELGIRHS